MTAGECNGSGTQVRRKGLGRVSKRAAARSAGRVWRTYVAFALAGLALPASAEARSTVEPGVGVEGSVLVQGSTSSDAISVTATKDEIRVSDSEGVSLRPTPVFDPASEPNCEQTSATVVVCTNVTSSVAVEVRAGRGNDRITGTARDDFLDGGSGNDVIGGLSGRDFIDDHSGKDTIRAGGGPDVVRVSGSTSEPDRGRDRINCGLPSKQQLGSLEVILDRDTVFAEATDRVRGCEVGETTGDERGNWMRGATPMFGRTGNDFMVGGPGKDKLFGNEGRDRIFGRSGRDRLYGGSGGDKLYGGTGRDRLYGQRGNDRINSRDRSRDLVFCGSGGRDLAKIDRHDRAFACERVSRR